MGEAFVQWFRTPIGRFGGNLSSIRPDDLLASVIKRLVKRILMDNSKIDDVIIGCANQAGEDNRNIARMASLLADLSSDVPGMTINRLCGSGLNAVGIAANAIVSGESDLIIAGGVESMSRAPLVIPKSDVAFYRRAEIFDTTIGWRFVNPVIKSKYGIDSMPETAENVAEDFKISREDQDLFAHRSQERAKKAIERGVLSTKLFQ